MKKHGFLLVAGRTGWTLILTLGGAPILVCNFAEYVDAIDGGIKWEDLEDAGPAQVAA